MPRLQSANNASATLSASITATDINLTVSDASTFPAVPFRITIDLEVMEVTAKAVNTFTVTRAKETTTAAVHNSGATVENRFTAGTHAELADQTDLTATKVGAITGINNVTNPGGVVNLVAGTGVTVTNDNAGKNVTIAVQSAGISLNSPLYWLL